MMIINKYVETRLWRFSLTSEKNYELITESTEERTSYSDYIIFLILIILTFELLNI